MDTDFELAQDAADQAMQDAIGYSDDEHAPFMAYVKDNYSRPSKDDYHEAYSAFQDAYQGEWDSLGEFCQEQAEECYDTSDLPSWITSHIDWEAVWSHELRFDYSAISVDGDGLAPYWVFRNV